MTRRRERRVVRYGLFSGLAAVLALAGVAVLAAPAAAGGSVWTFDRPYYEPGDVVRAGAAVSWDHSGFLGTPEDGPYGVWIAPVEDPVPTIVWPPQLDADVASDHRVADVHIEHGAKEINGVRHGPNVARVEFRLPRLAPGLYSLLHCNDPCTTTLGDITWGVFWVGPPEPGAVSTSGHAPLLTAPHPPTTAALPPTTSPVPSSTTTSAARPGPETTPTSTSAQTSGQRGIPAVPVLVGLVVLGAVGTVVARSRDPR